MVVDVVDRHHERTVGRGSAIRCANGVADALEAVSIGRQGRELQHRVHPHSATGVDGKIPIRGGWEDLRASNKAERCPVDGIDGERVDKRVERQLFIDKERLARARLKEERRWCSS